jgi:hypothetical protein
MNCTDAGSLLGIPINIAILIALRKTRRPAWLIARA